MTGIKITLLGAMLALAGILQSEHLDAWAKLTAVPMLGGVIFALLWFNSRNHRSTLESHSAAIDKVVAGIDGIREDNKAHLESQNQTLREFLKERSS